MREFQSESTSMWTFKGVKRVADTEPVITKPDAPVLSFGKKLDGQQAADKPK